MVRYLGNGMLGLQVGGYPHRKTVALFEVNLDRVEHYLVPTANAFRTSQEPPLLNDAAERTLSLR